MNRKTGITASYFLLILLAEYLALSSASFAYGVAGGCTGISGTHCPTGFGGTRGGANGCHPFEVREKISVQLVPANSGTVRSFSAFGDIYECIDTINKAEFSLTQAAKANDAYLDLIKNYALPIDLNYANHLLATSSKRPQAKLISVTFPTKIGDCNVSGNGELPWKITTPKGQWVSYSLRLSQTIKNMISSMHRAPCPEIETRLTDQFLSSLHRYTVSKNADRIALQITIESTSALPIAAELAPHREQFCLWQTKIQQIYF